MSTRQEPPPEESELPGLQNGPYRALVEQVRDFAIYMMDPEGHSVTWNEGVLLLTGYEESEFLGQHASVLFTEEDRARGEVERELHTAVSVGRASDDRWLVRKNGSRFWANGITTRLNDAAGRMIGFSKVFRNMTAEKEAQDRLQDSEERLRVALLAARMGIWRLHLPTNTQRVDPSMARLLGVGEGEVVESYEQFRDHIHPEDRARVDAAFARAIESGEDMHVEFRAVWPDGTIRWLLDHGTVVRKEGRPEFFTGAAIDVTDRKLAEERLVEAQRMDAVGQLAGGVAHEINNMMTVALGFSDLLLEQIGPEDPHHADLQHIRRAADRAASITGQLLAFSRRQVLQPEILDLNVLIRGLEPMLRQLLGEDKVFSAELSDDLASVRADPGQMEQVLINLSLNARDALSSGGSLSLGTRTVTVESMGATPGGQDGPPPGRYALVTVTDTGHGMDAGTRARVFEPFFTTKPVGQGTGLGLATVFGIVRQSGGTVVVDSAPGQGTTFGVYLPAVAAEAGEPARPSDQLVDRGKETVLVVEDEELLRSLVCQALESHGYRCLEARHGVEALKIARHLLADIDVIVTDVVMPSMGGRELARHVTEMNPSIPILFVSAYAGVDVIRRGLIEPGVPFLQKPFTMQALVRKLREILRGASV